MKFDEVLGVLLSGGSIRRKNHLGGKAVFVLTKKSGEKQLRIGCDNQSWLYKPDYIDLVANDWEVVGE